MLHVFSASPLIQGFILGFTAAACSIVIGYILADTFAGLAKIGRRRSDRRKHALAYTVLLRHWAESPDGHITRGYHERLR